LQLLNKHKCENKSTISSKNTFPLGKARRFVHTSKDLQERKNLLAWTKRGGGRGISKSQNGILSMQDKICSQPSSCLIDTNNILLTDTF
jgi:hypothetical protein